MSGQSEKPDTGEGVDPVVGGDELDPDLIALPRPKPRVGPVFCGSVLVMVLMLLVRISPEIRYTLSADTPVAFESAAALVKAAPDNLYVSVPATPDTAVDALIRKSQAQAGRWLHPVFGTNGGMWLSTSANEWRMEAHYDTVITGRLRRLGDLDIQDDLRASLAEHPVPRYATPEHLQAAIGKLVINVGGSDIAVTADTLVEIEEHVAGQFEVTGFYSEELPDEVAWTTALRAGGLEIVSERSVRFTADSWTFQVRGKSIADIKASLSRARLYSTLAEEVVTTHRTTFGSLASDDTLKRPKLSKLSIDGHELQWSSVSAVVVFVPYPVSGDALLLEAGAAPSVYDYALLMLAGLITVGFTFALLLYRNFRPAQVSRRAARPRG